jgi:TrmH RNA methyltransferase
MRRPQDIRRVYVTEQTLPRFKDVLGYCADKKLAYHVKTDLDLDAVAETVHHDGVLFLALARREGVVDDVTAFADRLAASERVALVLLEDVKNPHNLGAILRVCAHFGVPFCLRTGATPALSPAVLRTAEGGAEHTTLVDAGDVDAAAALLVKLRARGFRVLATSSHATVQLGRAPVPNKSVVMFGSEGSGLSKPLLDLADDVVAIPGSGALESLNVACASSIVLWELWKGSPASPVAASSERDSHAVAPRRPETPPRRPRRADQPRGRRGV